MVVGGPNDLGKVRADKLDVEFSLGDLMRGEWRANELTINGIALDLGLDREGKIDWPASNGTFDFASLAIDRLNLTGRVALHDAASRATLELSDIAFSGDVRSLAGSVRGGGNFTIDGMRYPFRVSSGQGGDGSGNRVHLSIDPGDRPLAADLEGVLSFQSRVPRFEGMATLASPPAKKGSESATTPWKITAKVKANYSAAQLDQIELSYGNEDRALKFVGTGDARFGTSPLLHAALSARQLDADKFMARDDDKDAAAPVRVLPAFRAALAALPRLPMASQIDFGAEQIMLGGRPLQNLSGGLHGDAVLWAIDRLDLRAPGSTRVAFNAARAPVGATGNFSGVLDIDSSDPDVLFAWLQGRGDVAYRNQKPLRLHGDVSVAADRISHRRAEGGDQRWRGRGPRRAGDAAVRRRLAPRGGAEGGQSRSRCGRRIRPLAADGMAGGSVRIARHRPRAVGRPGAEAADRASRLHAKGHRPRPRQDRLARQCHAGRPRQFRPRPRDRQAHARRDLGLDGPACRDDHADRATDCGAAHGGEYRAGAGARQSGARAWDRQGRGRSYRGIGGTRSRRAAAQGTCLREPPRRWRHRSARSISMRSAAAK